MARGVTGGALTLAAALAFAPAAGAAPAVPAPVASGTTASAPWTVTPAGAGSWDVDLTLPGGVPVRAAQPQLVVDGVLLGTAREDSDRRTLTVQTSDPRVARARSVRLAWNGVVAGQEARVLKHAAAPAAAQPDPGSRTLADDPGAKGRYAVTRADYDLGDTAVRLPGLGGQAVEERAAVYLPKGATGPVPSSSSCTAATRPATAATGTSSTRAGRARAARSRSRATSATARPPRRWPPRGTRSSRSAPTGSTPWTTRPRTAAPRPAASSSSPTSTSCGPSRRAGAAWPERP